MVFINTEISGDCKVDTGKLNKIKLPENLPVKKFITEGNKLLCIAMNHYEVENEYESLRDFALELSSVIEEGFVTFVVERDEDTYKLKAEKNKVSFYIYTCKWFLINNLQP